MRFKYALQYGIALSILPLIATAQMSESYNKALNHQTEASSIFMAVGYKGRIELHQDEIQKLTKSLSLFEQTSTQYAKHLTQSSSSNDCRSAAKTYLSEAPKISNALQQPPNYWANFVESGAMDLSMDVIDAFNNMATETCIDDLFN